REVVVLRGAEKAETIRQRFQHTFREDETALFGLCSQDFEDELLLTHARSAGHVHALGNLRKFGDRHLLEIGQIVKALVFTVAAFSGFSFGSFSGCYSAAAIISIGVVVRA